MKHIITIQNVNTNEYFFTTDHCQKHNLGDDWVSATHYMPCRVVPRESCPDGLIKDKDTYKKVFHYDGIEIPNPNPEFQA